MSLDQSTHRLARSLADARRRPPFVWQHRFMPTGFSRRLLELLEYALATQQWYLVFAQSGDGKSTTLRRFRRLHPAFDRNGARQCPVLATRTPTGRQSADHLVLALAQGLGSVGNLKASFLRGWLPGAVHRAGVQLIVIDDAHELTIAQLNYLRELTDLLKDFGTRPPVVLLATTSSSSPAEQPIWKLIERAGLDSVQFSNRLDGVSPLALVAGLSRVEVGDVLKTLEKRYASLFPELHLASWTASMFEWLTEERIDRAKLEKARMGALCDVVKGALQEVWVAGLPEPDGMGELLHRAAIGLATRGSAFEVIDEELKAEPEAGEVDDRAKAA